jgi:hypothetical protein
MNERDPIGVAGFVALLIRRARDGNPDGLTEYLEARGEMTEELYQYLAGVLSGKERRPGWRPRRNKNTAILEDLIDWPTWDKNTTKDVAKKHGVSVATVNRLTAKAKGWRGKRDKPFEPWVKEWAEERIFPLLPPDPDDARKALRIARRFVLEFWNSRPNPDLSVKKSRT